MTIKKIKNTFIAKKDDIMIKMRFPEMKVFPQKAQLQRAKLRRYHQEYVEKVSSKDMAASLELSVFISVLCELFSPKRILDLGSGFSSFVFHNYASQVENKPLIWSVDDDQQWLDKTSEFLTGQGLEAENLQLWSEFKEQQHDSFDFILHDLGSMKVRKQALETVINLATPEALIVLDDVHKPKYLKYAKSTVEKLECQYYLMKSYTQDSFGRYAMLVTRS